MTWSMVTAPDELERCCFVDAQGVHCDQRTAFRVAAKDGAMDDYGYVCADHVQLVSGPGYAVERVS